MTVFVFIFTILLIVMFVKVHLMIWSVNDPDGYFDFSYDVWHYFRKIRHVWYALVYGIENLIDWLPIIWKDRDWDEHYLLIVMNKKFERMEKLHREHGHLVRSPRTAHELMIAKNLTKRMIDDDYLSNALYEHDKKYGDDFEFKFKPCENNPKLHVLVDNSPEDERESFRKASKHSRYMEKQDYDMLFDLMKKHIRTWWD